MVKLNFGPVRKKKTKKVIKTKIVKVTEEKKEQLRKHVMIYVGNLSYKRDEKGVEALFNKFGKVEHVKIIYKEGSELKSGVAFVEMNNIEKAKDAIKALDGKEVDGRTLKVSIANDRFAKNPSKK